MDATLRKVIMIQPSHEEAAATPWTSEQTMPNRKDQEREKPD
jgi:hypothetical protein